MRRGTRSSRSCDVFLMFYVLQVHDLLYRRIVDLLRSAFDGLPHPPRRRPVGQLIKSLISSRTRDAVSLAAFHALRDRFGVAAAIAAAEPEEVAKVIAPVTFFDVKAERLVAALRMIANDDPTLRLNHLAALSTTDALVWLERLPGVGRKTAASVLNFSTMDRPVLVVDSHVVRVLARLGLTSRDAAAASERVSATWVFATAADFRDLHVALKKLGQQVCRWDVPQCRACPLESSCATATVPAKTVALPLWTKTLTARMG